MNLTSSGKVLMITGVIELNATNAAAFRDQVRTTLQPQHETVEIDFSTARFVDSSGLGALIAIHKTVCGRGGLVRIIRPTPAVLQILELTRMHRIFEIVP
jgi:anti-sigma B factor antagonist